MTPPDQIAPPPDGSPDPTGGSPGSTSSPQEATAHPAPGTTAAQRRRTVVMAGHRGDALVARDHLDDPDAAVRSSAIAALARMGEVDAVTVTAGLADPDPAVRRRAATVSSRVGGTTDALLAALDDRDHGVVEVAAFALGEIAHAEGAEEVVDRLGTVATDHDDALCRESAVAALGSIGHPRGRDAVLAACGDKASVRRRAVLALAAFDGDVVSAMLRSLTGDRDLQVRQAAEDLVAIEDGEDV